MTSRYYRGIVFLDRDGTINVDEKGYTYKIEDFKFLPGAWEGIRKLNENYFKVVVVTNQSGIAKGMYSQLDLKKFNSHLIMELHKRNTILEEIYFCPYLTGITRKPNPGMFINALNELSLNYLTTRYVIGDRLTDLEAGSKVNCKKILVKTGHGINEYKKIKKMEHTPDYYAEQLLDAANWIIKQNK